MTSSEDEKESNGSAGPTPPPPVHTNTSAEVATTQQIQNAGLSQLDTEKDQESISRPEASHEKPARDEPDIESLAADPAAEPVGGIIGRVLSKTTTRVSVDPGPPPDGGWQAWNQALMGHLVVFNVWGNINSFGVSQAYYLTSLPGTTPSSISWIGSMQIFLLFSIGTFSGRALDAGLFRPTFALGALFYLVGIFTTSACTSYWQIFLAQGVCTGIGNGLMFCPSVALLSTYFLRRRSLAIAVAASGTATGGMVFPAMMQQLLPRIGFPWTIRAVGFVMLATLATAFTFMRTRLPPRKSGPLVEWRAFTELPYLLFCIGMFLNFWGFYFAYYYLPSFGRNVLHISDAQAINNLLILNGVGLFGRLVPGYIADRFFGPLNTLIPVVFLTGILLYAWTGVTSQPGLIAFCVIYGFIGAGTQSLLPATLTSLTTDLKRAGVRMGMCFSVISFAFLTGSPLGGALVQRDGGGYIGAQVFAASVIMAGCLTLVACRLARAGTAKAKV